MVLPRIRFSMAMDTFLGKYTAAKSKGQRAEAEGKALELSAESRHLWYLFLTLALACCSALSAQRSALRPCPCPSLFALLIFFFKQSRLHH